MGASVVSLRVCLVGLLIAIGAASARAGTEPPQVVVSIKPIHALVAQVMKGIGTPTLLIKAAGSPHTYSLRPSDARALARARIVFYVDGSVETFLERPLKSLARGATVVALLEQPGIARLKAREGGLWHGQPHEGADDRDHGPKRTGDRAHGEYDGHIWLDPRNAKRIVEIAVTVLSKIDPANRTAYARNGKAAARSLDALDKEIGDKLAPVQRRPYIVVHDAYRYLEHRYGLNAAGSITVSPDRRPGAKRLSEIRSYLSSKRVRCVFAEPQFRAPLVRTVVRGTAARFAILDPLGADIPAGLTAYDRIMRRLAAGLADCLGRPG